MFEYYTIRLDSESLRSGPGQECRLSIQETYGGKMSTLSISGLYTLWLDSISPIVNREFEHVSLRFQVQELYTVDTFL